VRLKLSKKLYVYASHVISSYKDFYMNSILVKQNYEKQKTNQIVHNAIKMSLSPETTI